MSTVTNIDVTGMTCGHCVSAVTSELSAIPGVTAVEVDLHPEGVTPVTITSEAPLDPTAVSEAVDEAGYALAAQV